MSGEAAVRAAFKTQAAACRSLDSPFTARLCELAAARLTAAGPAGTHILDWPGEPSYRGDSVPLRFCGALHHLVITDRSPALAAVYPPAKEAGEDDDRLWRAVEMALSDHEAAIIAFLADAPQTNEVRRAAALLPLWIWASGRFGLPLVVSELGASAGLNLCADLFSLDAGGALYGMADSPVRLTPVASGRMPSGTAPQVAERRGCDLAPLDPQSPADREKLLAYIWPDQPERVERTQAAMAIAASADPPASVERADARDWLEKRLGEVRPGRVHLIQHTVAWQYFPDDVQAGCADLLAEAGRRASLQAPIVRIGMEADDNPHGAAIAMTCWPEGERYKLGRVDFHGRWIEWTGDALS